MHVIMSYYRITISYAEDFITFNISDEVFDYVNVGDRLKYDDYILVVSNRLLVAGTREKPFNQGDIVYECLYRPTSSLEFYKSLDYFKNRFDFLGGILTNKPEPALAYKIYRLYCRLNSECIDTKIPLESGISVLRLFHILGLDIDVDFSKYVVDGFIDLLVLLFDCVSEDDLDASVFSDFDNLQINYNKSLLS